MLHKIDTKGWDENTAWCVPTAVSLLTGASLIHSHSRAAMIRNKTLSDVSGVEIFEATLMLREQGYVAKAIKLTERFDEMPTMNQFLKTRTAYEMCMPLMLNLTGYNFNHTVVAHYGSAADNWTMKPVPFKQFPHLRRRVGHAWIVERNFNHET